MIGRAASLLLVLIAGTAGRDDPLAGRVAGQPLACIDLDRVQGPEIVDGHTILYRQNLARVWRTGPDGNCAPMRSGDGVIAEVHGRRLCRGDRFRVRAPGYVSAGVCRFAGFTPYDKAS